MGTRYHVVEPHADDAFLSLHSHMVEWIRSGDSVTIHTLIPVKTNSLINADHYAQKIGADWKGYDIGRQAVNRYKLDINWKEQVILPLAITHPEHIVVRDWLEVKGVWFYVDQPYAITQRNSPRLTDRLRNMEVISFRKPSALKYKHASIFTSQAKFFYFNGPDKLRETFEMIVCPIPGRRTK